MNLPTLTKLAETAAQTTWEAQFPSALSKQGGAYRVVTYPNSDLIYVTSWVRNRRVVNARRIEQIKAGLKHATHRADQGGTETRCIERFRLHKTKYML